MPDINIKVQNKRAAVEGAPVIICGNSDYVLKFTFDSEWSAATYKTARFVYVQDGKVKHSDVDFTGTTAKVPVLTNTTQVKVGVYAGELYTSTPAVIPCKLSILCGSGEPAVPTPEEDARIIELLNLAIKQQAQAEAAVDEVNASAAAAAASAADAEDAKDYVNAIVAGNEAYTKHESDLRYSAIILQEASGESITVQDSADAPFYTFGIEGKSTQATYTGKNLFDGVWGDDNTSTNMIAVTAGTKYVYSESGVACDAVINFYDATGAFKMAWEIPAGMTYTNAADGFIRIFKEDTSKVNCMLEAGDTVTEYEPYVGGVASPSPDNPQAINSVGDSGSVEVVSIGKNLLNATLKTNTINGVTCTANGDGTYILNGTATATCYFPLSAEFTNLALDTSYRITGCPSGGHLNTYSLYDDKNSYSDNYSRDSGDGRTYVAKAQPKIYMRVQTGATCNNLLFKPMLTTDLEATYDDYEPYKETKATLTLADPLRSLPNGTKDELIFNSDGTGKIVRRVGVKTFVGSSGEGWRYATSLGNQFIVALYSKALESSLLCDKYTVAYVGWYGATVNDKTLITLTGDYATTEMRIRYDSITSLDDWLAYISENPITLQYELATPTEEELSAEQVAEIVKLRTFSTVTNISTSDSLSPTLAVEYSTDTKTYIDNKFAELSAAMLNS